MAMKLEPLRQGAKAPAMALPMVTGIRFFTKMSPQLSGAPEKMPAGRMNMFATECSKPMAMNMEIGNHTPTILPERSCSSISLNPKKSEKESLAIVQSQTAMQTSQLHMMPFTSGAILIRHLQLSCHCLPEGCGALLHHRVHGHFLRTAGEHASVASNSLGLRKTNSWIQVASINKQPQMLPMYAMVQLRIRSCEMPCKVFESLLMSLGGAFLLINADRHGGTVPCEELATRGEHQ